MKSKNSKILHSILHSFIGLGVGIRVFQFIYNRSLWYDEATLALNIIEKDFVQLVSPLDYNQVAPILYLYIQKTLTLILGEHDFVLRISSLVGGIAFLYFSYVLAKKLLDQTGALITTALLAISYPLVYYSTEAKPYMLDALTFVILFLFYFKIKEHRRGKIYFSIAGIVAVWFSFPSIFVLASIGLFSIHEQPISKLTFKKGFEILGMHLPWVMSFLLNYYFVIHGHSNAGQMTSFWEQHFMPSLFPLDKFLVWNAKHFAQLFYTILGFGKWISVLCICLFLLAISQIIKKKDFKILLFCFPLVLHLGLSYFHIYPFVERLVLYSAFSFAFLTAYGLECIKSYQLKLLPISLIAVLIISLAFITIKKLPIEREEAKLVIKILNNKVEPKNNIYVYYGAAPAIKFYRKKLLINEDKIVYGKEFRDSPEKYYEEIEKIKGTTWLVFTHYLASELVEILQKFEENEEKRIIEQKTSDNSLKIFLLEKK